MLSLIGRKPIARGSAPRHVMAAGLVRKPQKAEDEPARS